MSPEEYVRMESKRMCLDQGIPEAKAEDIAETAWGEFRRHKLRTAKDVYKWVNGAARSYKTLMKNSQKR